MYIFLKLRDIFSARCCQKANKIYENININEATTATILDIYEIFSINILLSESES
jgi:hypothetical protein